MYGEVGEEGLAARKTRYVDGRLSSSSDSPDTRLHAIVVFGWDQGSTWSEGDSESSQKNSLLWQVAWSGVQV